MDYIWLEQSLRAYSFLINQSFFASILTTSSLSYMLMSNTCVIYSLLYIIHEYLMYMSANTPNAPICTLYVLLRITLMPRIRALYVLLRITLMARIECLYVLLRITLMARIEGYTFYYELH